MYDVAGWGSLYHEEGKNFDIDNSGEPMLGYSSNRLAYQLWGLERSEIVETRNLVFHEKSCTYRHCHSPSMVSSSPITFSFTSYFSLTRDIFSLALTTRNSCWRCDLLPESPEDFWSCKRGPRYPLKSWFGIFYRHFIMDARCCCYYMACPNGFSPWPWQENQSIKQLTCYPRVLQNLEYAKLLICLWCFRPKEDSSKN